MPSSPDPDLLPSGSHWHYPPSGDSISVPPGQSCPLGLAACSDGVGPNVPALYHFILIILNMSIEIFSIGLVIIVLFILPFLLSGRTKKKEVKLLNQKLDELASENGLQIMEKDLWDKSAIGLDTQKKGLLFVKIHESQCHCQSVPLSGFSSAAIEKEYRGTADEGELKSLNLRLEPKDPKNQALLLAFYQGSKTAWAVENEVELIMKWQARLNQILKQ